MNSITARGAFFMRATAQLRGIARAMQRSAGNNRRIAQTQILTQLAHIQQLQRSALRHRLDAQ
ncbi:hypothetical protein AE929_19695, partial [Xanthomonas arboricola]